MTTKAHRQRKVTAPCGSVVKVREKDKQLAEHARQVRNKQS